MKKIKNFIKSIRKDVINFIYTKNIKAGVGVSLDMLM